MDEAQSASQGRSQDRGSNAPSEAAEVVRPGRDTPAGDLPPQLTAAESAGPPAGSAQRTPSDPGVEDESAVRAGSLEAFEIDAAARGESLASAAPVAREQPLPAASSIALDFAEADRFAASIRPSWSDPAPVSQPPLNVIGAADGAARVIRHNTRTDLNLPLRKRRGSAYAILGGSLIGVAALLYLGVSSSTIDHASQRGMRALHSQASKQASPSPETRTQPALRADSVAPALQPRAAQPSAPTEPAPAAPSATQAAAPEPGSDVPGVPKPSAGAAPAEGVAVDNAAATAPAVAERAVEPATAAEVSPPRVPAPSEQPTAAALEQPAAASAEQVATASGKLPGAHLPAAPPIQPSVTTGPTALAVATPSEKPASPSAAEPPALKPLPGGADRNKLVLDLAAYPPNTRLRLDGMIIQNPYRGRLPKASKHRVDAAAPGFVSESHVMRMEADVQLMISLKREQPKDVKADPYSARRASPAPTQLASPSAQKRDRGAGFVAENPY